MNARARPRIQGDVTRSTSDLRVANDAVRRVLDHLGLPTYLYAVRLEGQEWLVEVEQPVDGEWLSVEVRAPRALLLAALSDPFARSELAGRWSDALRDRPAA